ncbi:serine/threonine protein kinase [Streptomyces sp. MST-110588]|nr:serine/threonine protein kinase [Streptomyces sp. MST-110588]
MSGGPGDGSPEGGRSGGGRSGGGRVLAGRYRLIDELGRGGMGVVWRARDELLHREVAIKEVRAPRALTEAEERLLYARLEREGRAAARISHPNVITVYDVLIEGASGGGTGAAGEPGGGAAPGGRPWIVMELIRGLSLADVLEAEGPMAPARAAAIGARVLAALRVAHTAGVLHRDVKPGNVLLANDGRVVLTDFGIATVAGSSALTMTGELVGSPEFLAPERALGRTPGPESDLWSLGVTLYAAVEGYSPFRQDTPLSTLRAVVDERVPPPRRAGPLTPVLDGLLRKDPRERLEAARAQHMLEEVAGGGAPPTVVVPPAGGYTPTVAAPGPAYSPAGPAVPPEGGAAFPPEGGTGAAGQAGAGGRDTGGRGRRPALLAAGAVLALLAVVATAWALVNGSGGGGQGGQGAHSGSAGGGGTSTSGGGAGSGGKDSGSPSTGGSGTPGKNGGGTGGGGNTTSKPPPRPTVTVYVTAVRDRYTGACPPAAGAAPAFSAVIGVDHGPAEVVYRWITDSGRTSDPAWKTASFTGHGSGKVTVHHTETTYEAGGTLTDRIGVRVKSPVSVESDRVSFSVTCEEAPTGGASSSPADGGTYSGGSTGTPYAGALATGTPYAAERRTGR